MNIFKLSTKVVGSIDRLPFMRTDKYSAILNIDSARIVVDVGTGTFSRLIRSVTASWV